MVEKFDITVRAPGYIKHISAWQMMRDAIDGEDTVKAAGETYLPMKSAINAMADTRKKGDAYDAYKKEPNIPKFSRRQSGDRLV